VHDALECRRHECSKCTRRGAVDRPLLRGASWVSELFRPADGWDPDLFQTYFREYFRLVLQRFHLFSPLQIRGLAIRNLDRFASRDREPVLGWRRPSEHVVDHVVGRPASAKPLAVPENAPTAPPAEWTLRVAPSRALQPRGSPPPRRVFTTSMSARLQGFASRAVRRRDRLRAPKRRCDRVSGEAGFRSRRPFGARRLPGEERSRRSRKSFAAIHAANSHRVIRNVSNQLWPCMPRWQRPSKVLLAATASELEMRTISRRAERDAGDRGPVSHNWEHTTAPRDAVAGRCR
jgi:hypothetical protein